MNMADEPNIHQPEWDAEMPDPPFRAKAMRAGARAGSQELGATVYEIDAGGAISPYHFHHANEELLVVLSGSPEVRTPAGRRRLNAGAVVAFARGEDGAHAVTNPGPEAARVLLVSTMRFPDVAEHLDTGALLAITGQAAGRVFPAGSDVSFPDAVLSAIEAGAEDGGDEAA
jgi:uncharacterized cupin superfamily protein